MSWLSKMLGGGGASSSDMLPQIPQRRTELDKTAAGLPPDLLSVLEDWRQRRFVKVDLNSRDFVAAAIGASRLGRTIVVTPRLETRDFLHEVQDDFMEIYLLGLIKRPDSVDARDLGRLVEQLATLAAKQPDWMFVDAISFLDWQHERDQIEVAIVKLSQEVDLDTTTLVLLAPESWTRGPAQSKVDRAESELSSPEE